MKKLAILIAGLAVIAVGFVIWASFNLNDIVKSAIESNGSALTESIVQVEAVNIEAEQARASIMGLTIGNPPGYSDAIALSFDSIDAALNRDQFTMDLVVVEALEIRNPVVFYELGLGGNNMDALLEAVNRNSGSNASSRAETDYGPKFIIRKLTIGKGEITAFAAGQEASSDLPAVVLRDIGGAEGVSSSEIGRIIISELTSNTLNAVTRGAIDDLLNGVDGDIKGIMDGLLRRD